MSTCLGRLGSRFSLILDPVRRRVHYGTLGLMCQHEGQMVIGITDPTGRMETLPLCEVGSPFYTVDQRLTMTSVRYEAYSIRCGIKLTVTLTAPFWPQDERTCLLPAYFIRFTVERTSHLVRWNLPNPDAPCKGQIVFSIQIPGIETKMTRDGLALRYPVKACDVNNPDGPLAQPGPRDVRRQNPIDGTAHDLVMPTDAKWTTRNDMLVRDFDVSGKQQSQRFALVMAGYCGDALFERMGEALPLKYTNYWRSSREVAQYAIRHRKRLVEASKRFDRLWLDSSMPPAGCDLTALAFQSYLMNTLWCTAGARQPEWFSVWEGTCWFNSTVDVTYNEAMFYFACWPELLEKIFEQWTAHVNDHAGEQRRRAVVSDDDWHGNPDVPFPGAVLEHDMGSGWSANGQSYWHAMPVEENSNFLLLLYAHGTWWNRKQLFERHQDTCRQLVEYLFWADSTGNGFPDRGVANTIDDATPAVQYGRDNVYLGIKRLAALHAASRIFDHLRDKSLAKRCKAEVRRAVKTLNKGWLGDHWGVCLDKSAKGLVDNRTGEPLPYRTLPGWDAYSLYTTNGLLYLLMLDDLPPGISKARLREDVVKATRKSMQTYGCGHSSLDTRNMWVSMNLWRDCAAAYLGVNMIDHTQRYWAQQLFANGIGSDKPNCFTETSITNNLVWYPRGAAAFGLPMALARLTRKRQARGITAKPLDKGNWPLLPLCDWKDHKTRTTSKR